LRGPSGHDASDPGGDDEVRRDLVPARSQDGEDDADRGERSVARTAGEIPGQISGSGRRIFSGRFNHSGSSG